jgi:hypothetical protein
VIFPEAGILKDCRFPSVTGGRSIGCFVNRSKSISRAPLVGCTEWYLPKRLSPGGDSKDATFLRFDLRQFGWAWILLISATLFAYLPVFWNGFIDFDDDMYLTKNPAVFEGLTPASVRFAFTTFLGGNWMPVTWLSYLFDISLFGISAPAIHGMNLLLHCANACLLLLVLQRMTGAYWRSVLVAAIFSLHPLHVESVVWAAERKDVLSTFWALVALLFYERYAAQPRISLSLAVLMSFLLGLMSKPMLVTLPLLMGLLDVWPLRRFAHPLMPPDENPPYPARTRVALVAEKAPLLALSLFFGIVTIIAQQQSSTISSMAVLPLWARIANTAIAVAFYVEKTFLPFGLCGYYAHPLRQVDGMRAVFGGVAMAAFIAAVCIAGRRGRPWLPIGWFWFLIALLPVCGLLQVGSQAYADRYSYIPQIGLLILIVWTASQWALHHPHSRKWLVALAVLVLISEGVLTARQVTFWRDPSAFWGRAARFNPASAVINSHLGKLGSNGVRPATPDSL